jgi:hypothetical protein
MGKSKKLNITMVISLVFLLIGVALILVACKNDILNWISKFGITVVVIATPVLILCIFLRVKKKIDEM